MKRIVLGVVLGATFVASSAWALESLNDNLLLLDGSVTATCVNGGTGTGTAGAAAVLLDPDGTTTTNGFRCSNTIPATMVNGTLAPSNVVSTCGNNQYLKMNAGGTALECAAVTAGTTLPQLITANAETRLRSPGASATNTVYMALNGKLAPSGLGFDTVYTPIQSATTFNNLRCRTDANIPTNGSITVRLHFAECTASEATFVSGTTNQFITLNAGQSAGLCTTAVNIAAPNPNANCVGYRVVLTNVTTPNLQLNCAIEKTGAGA